MDADLLLSRMEAVLPLNPLFNRMLSYQQRTIKAKQLAQKLYLPRTISCSESPIPATTLSNRDTRKRKNNLDFKVKLPRNRTKKTHRLPPLPQFSPIRRQNLPLEFQGEMTDLSGNIRREGVEIVSKSVENGQNEYKKVSVKIVKSVHTLDITAPLPEPVQQRRRFPQVQYKGRRGRQRLPSLQYNTREYPSSKEKRTISPDNSSGANSPYNLSRYFHDSPFHLPKSLHPIPLTHRIPPITAASNESEETPFDSVLDPVFS